MKAVDKLIQRQKLTKEEFIEILKQQDDPDIRELLKRRGRQVKKTLLWNEGIYKRAD